MAAKKPSKEYRKGIFILTALSALLIAGVIQLQKHRLRNEDEIRKEWFEMVREIYPKLKGYGGKVGFVLKDLERGFEFRYNSNSYFPAASVIKIPIMVAVYKEVMDGKLELDTRILLERGDKVSGSGFLKYVVAGEKIKLGELVELMIAQSDNTATKLLTELLGYERLNKVFRKIGLRNTNITPQLFNLNKWKVEDETYTTPDDMAMLLEDIYEKRILTYGYCWKMMNVLKKSRTRSRLKKYLPRKWKLAHKTGLLRGACHDVGIVYSDKGQYLICILTANNKSYSKAKEFIAKLGRVVYDFDGCS